MTALKNSDKGIVINFIRYALALLGIIELDKVVVLSHQGRWHLRAVKFYQGYPYADLNDDDELVLLLPGGRFCNSSSYLSVYDWKPASSTMLKYYNDLTPTLEIGHLRGGTGPTGSQG